MRDGSNVAAQSGNDFLMPSTEFLHFGALAIEGRYDFFVIVR
jgi:hypothetical protein